MQEFTPSDSLRYNGRFSRGEKDVSQKQPKFSNFHISLIGISLNGMYISVIHDRKQLY